MISIPLDSGGLNQQNIEIRKERYSNESSTYSRARRDGNTLIQPLEDKMRASQAVMQAIASGQLKVTVSRTFPLGQVAAAHQAIEDNLTYGKVVLTM